MGASMESARRGAVGKPLEYDDPWASTTDWYKTPAHSRGDNSEPRGFPKNHMGVMAGDDAVTKMVIHRLIYDGVPGVIGPLQV
jgi:hypothetical protein